MATLREHESLEVQRTVERIGEIWDNGFTWKLGPFLSTAETVFLDRRGVNINQQYWGLRKYLPSPIELEEAFLKLLYEDRFVLLNNRDFIFYLSKRPSLSQSFFLYLASHPFGYWHCHAGGDYESLETRDYTPRTRGVPLRFDERLLPEYWAHWRFHTLNHVDFVFAANQAMTEVTMERFWLALYDTLGGVGLQGGMKETETFIRETESRWHRIHSRSRKIIPLEFANPEHRSGARLRVPKGTRVRARSVSW